MILSHQSLLKRLALRTDQRIVVDGHELESVSSHSIDVHLGETLINDEGSDSWEMVGSRAGWIVGPGSFYLGVTAERIVVPNDLRCQLDGVSTNARRGIVIHQTGGSVDAGWDGRLTLEITVLKIQRLMPRMRIGQLTFQLLDEATDLPYRGRYYRDMQPEGPK